MHPLIPLAMGQIVWLLSYKNSFSIKKNMKVDMPLKKETDTISLLAMMP